ncbi:Ppx/GppA phosphatase family protein [Pleomorphovibrio marinus]|uniref:Ppx/GppA phosphatase family protein n=1 Tax=Pleomorphovibrio marinus TaxID=2164132 RepID=UPI000E0A8067|nr:phosphatase [Pleomorphovibrio marinus]
MRLAAVDIGSNAIRLQITHVTQYQGEIKFKKLEYLRFPLRLGSDVFSTKKISPGNREKFLKLMQAFKLLIDLYEVEEHMVCATSAMRESTNGREIAKEVLKLTGLKIQIIDGNREAELINMALGQYIDNRTFLHIDVGGGSTELNIYKKSRKTASMSFKIGSVRTLDEKVSLSQWRKMDTFIKEHLKGETAQITCIGTGGNINKVFEISKPRKNKRYLELATILEVLDQLNGLTFEERIHLLNLNPDRSDVIIPATKIYLAAMQSANSHRMIVPDVGLKDGVMSYLFQKATRIR